MGRFATRMLIGAFVALLTVRADADINLQWRAASTAVGVGEVIEVGLYAVSDDGSPQAFAALDAIIKWDPVFLTLIATRDDGPYEWLLSTFPYDAALAGLNADCGPRTFCSPYTDFPFNDGDALYEVVAPFGLDPPPYATAEGLLVATFLFQASTPTESTELGFVLSVGVEASTQVIDAVQFSDVTGTLIPLLLTVNACGSIGDFNGDCRATLFDHAWFSACMAGPLVDVGEFPCGAADHDGDGDADLADAAIFQLFFSSP